MKGLGHYYSFSASSVVENEDLIATAASALGLDAIIPKKITLISNDTISIDINNLGVFSELYQDADLTYKLSLDYNDCEIHSLIVSASSASAIFLAMVF